MVNSIIQNILLPKDSYIWGTADLNKLIDKRICGICVSVCPIGKKNKKFTVAQNKRH